MTREEERQAFEAWWKQYWLHYDPDIPAQEYALAAWLARAALALPKSPEPGIVHYKDTLNADMLGLAQPYTGPERRSGVKTRRIRETWGSPLRREVPSPYYGPDAHDRRKS